MLWATGRELREYIESGRVLPEVCTERECPFNHINECYHPPIENGKPLKPLNRD